ncbi:uncharacterized protein LOC110845299 [Folsomia candida]|uniref:C2H2-type domain-containing protein n=1 Tax=Folsomia candida TaxID=158441 RepID=A0A226EUD0_FOLCA|nr:uncharacterized protein LOC110845299 [Folsomia candida]OXA60226.1 hypothetical protein Fcan01_05309 [Folsomia candida]
MDKGRLTLNDVGVNEVFYLDPLTDRITTRTAESLQNDFFEIHQLVGQIWTDSTNVKRDFTFGYTWLTSDERKNKMIKDKAKVRKTLNHSENHQHGCSYGDDMIPGCSANLENLVRLPLFSSDAYTGLQTRHRARRLKKDDKGSIMPENGERFIAADGTRDKLDAIIMSFITETRAQMISPNVIPLPPLTSEEKENSIPATVLKSTRLRLYCHYDKCNYVTVSKAELTAHINVHKGIKLFVCGTCKKRFSRNGNLKVHTQKGCEDRRFTQIKTPVKQVNSNRRALLPTSDLRGHEGEVNNGSTSTTSTGKTETAASSKRPALVAIHTPNLKQQKLIFPVIKKN